MQLTKQIMLTLSAGPATNAYSAGGTTKATGGPIKTALGYGVETNKKSSVTREWITVHDDSLPANIIGTTGVTTCFRNAGPNPHGDYEYNVDYTIEAKEDLSAVEVRFLTFDIWGEHSRNLSSTKVIDLPAGTNKKFKGTWDVYSENEVSECYASIAYVAQVRTKSGRVIKAKPKLVLQEARRFSRKFSKGDLEQRVEASLPEFIKYRDCP